MPMHVMIYAALLVGCLIISFWRGGAPERIGALWWRRADNAGLSRDYYRVEDRQGHRFWLFRHGLYGREAKSPAWYIHGLFA